MDDRSGIKVKLNPQTTVSAPPAAPGSCVTAPTASLTEFTSFSDQISTEETEISSTDVSVNPKKAADGGLMNDPKGGATLCGPPCSVEREQPKPLEASTVHEVTQFTSISRSQGLKPPPALTEPDSDDLCAAVLLACLFCHPVDCVLASVTGCSRCFWWWLCGCRPAPPPPPPPGACDPCGLLGVRCCFLCDCPVCDVCLQATECLDLAMEISQMLYH